jgi:hypothetical protein
MKAFLRAVAKSIEHAPFGSAILRAVRRKLEYRRSATRLSAIGASRDIFDHHYRTNEWGNKESVSGSGSTLRYTENIRREIPKLVTQFDVKAILDAPCGDFNWFGKIAFDRDIRYIGGDIVQALIESNQSRFGGERTSFVSLDITRDPLPQVDLWLCRDCLFHLSNVDIFFAINNFLRSDIQFLLTSTHTECDENVDIPTGSFRLLNLQLPPFSFCDPLYTIDDWIEGFPRRQLALWERKTLMVALESNKGVRTIVRRRA